MKNLNKETNKVVSYKITYKDFENNVKECIWSLRDFDVKRLTPQRLSDIKHYISTGEWIKRRGFKEERGRCYGMGSTRRIYCVAQELYYGELLSTVVSDIAMECIKDMEFANRLLRQANKEAKERDKKMLDKVNENEEEYRRDLNKKNMMRAKRTINKYIRRTFLDDAAFTYKAVISEYEMFEILKMEPYDGKPRYHADWWLELLDMGEQMRQEYYAMLLKKEADESKSA